MGWDAFSSAKYHWKAKRFADKELGKLFKDAAKKIKKKTGSVDWGLDKGLLDVNNCAFMLAEATGKNTYNPNGWSIDQVQQYHENANWNFAYNPENEWAYESAKEFLKICAENNLSIRFSF